MLIKYYLKHKKSIKYFNENKNYLLPGKYRFNELGNIVFLNNAKSLENTRKYLKLFGNKNSFIKNILRYILGILLIRKPKVVNSNNKFDFNGTHLFVSAKNNIKIFDFKSSRVLIKFNNITEFNKY